MRDVLKGNNCLRYRQLVHHGQVQQIRTRKNHGTSRNHATTYSLGNPMHAAALA